MEITYIFFSILFFLILLYSSIISFIEKEYRAARRLLITSVLISLLLFLIHFINYEYKEVIEGIVVSLLIISSLILLIPLGKRKYTFQVPSVRIDERDTMFSRNELKPGSERFAEYYKNNPEKKAVDDSWRKEAGLLRKGSSQFNPIHFAAADASFETIEALKHEVDGKVNPEKTITEVKEISNYIRKWTKKLGAIDVGITELKDYHLYSTGGRADRYGKNYSRRHSFAIAFTVEMNKEMVDSAPSGSIVMESGQQYLESGRVAVQLGNFLRNLGYEARAHIDGNYEVVCPLVARDAGLGEIGRMGLLMTPKLGPRVRLGVVTTNLELITDKSLNDYSMIDFCKICKKCADVCPSNAISKDDQKEIDGVKRWQIDQEKCFSLWCKMGTDCGRCISVCPYSHPDNLMHNIIRAGIKNSSLFRIFALKLDDFFYGRKPPTKALPRWLNIS